MRLHSRKWRSRSLRQLRQVSRSSWCCLPAFEDETQALAAKLTGLVASLESEKLPPTSTLETPEDALAALLEGSKTCSSVERKAAAEKSLKATKTAICGLLMDAASPKSEAMKNLQAAQARQESALAKLTADAPAVALR